MKTIKTCIRLPRPMGITQSMAEFHATNDLQLLKKIQSYLIQQWLISNGKICGRVLNVMELSEFIKCDPDTIRIHMRDQMLNTKLWDRDKQDELLSSLMGQQITWALEDRMEVENQLNILRKAQGNKYTPFVTSELNKVIGLKMGTTNTLQSVVRSLGNNGSVNIFNQFNQQNNMNEPGITIEDAIDIVQKENSKLLNSKELQYIEANYDINTLPEVVATEQDDVDVSKEVLTLKKGELDAIVDNYKNTTKDIEDLHHEIRREIELRVDLEAKDPELDIYPA